MAVTTTMTGSIPLVTRGEFAEAYEREKRVLVSLKNRKIYDVTDFLDAHPGGGDLIADYAGKDVSEIMDDVVSHRHSESAYEMLDEDYLVAILATKEEEDELLSNTNRISFKFDPNDESNHTVQTDFESDFKANQFLDLQKPLLKQMFLSNFTKEFYLEQIHKPRHYGKGSAPLFGNFLEPISKTPWYVIPIVWIPADIYVCTLALEGQSVPLFVFFYILGLCIWTLVEYIMHRFLFHLDDYLPRNNIAYTLHFLLHGVHHYLPMDPLRLVMPPALLVVLTTPFYKLAHFVFPNYQAKAVFAGAFFGYVIYDCTHYFLHHTQLPAFMKETKTNHLDHHYKDYQRGFGVTSKFWDRVFGTEMFDTDKRR